MTDPEDSRWHLILLGLPSLLLLLSLDMFLCYVLSGYSDCKSHSTFPARVPNVTFYEVVSSLVFLPVASSMVLAVKLFHNVLLLHAHIDNI